MGPLEDMAQGMKRDPNSNPIRSLKESTVDKSIILTIKGLAAKFGTFWLLICGTNDFEDIENSFLIPR